MYGHSGCVARNFIINTYSWIIVDKGNENFMPCVEELRDKIESYLSEILILGLVELLIIALLLPSLYILSRKLKKRKITVNTDLYPKD
jgi:hypothetical protein